MINKLRMGVRKVFTGCSLAFSWLSKITYRTPQENEVARWFVDNGDSSLRVEYALNSGSVVMDLGGYEGDWVAEIAARYACNALVFEPVPDYANRIRKRFLKNPKIKVFEFGLGKHNASAIINIGEEGSSLFKSPNVPTGNHSVQITIKNAAEFFESSNINVVDLMKINIEGGEYDLLEHLLDAGLIARIRNIQVQFHDFVPHAEERMRQIQERLAKTHSLTYQYHFVWENWAQRSN